MANAAAPTESGGAKLFFGHGDTGAAVEAVLPRFMGQSLLYSEDSDSGWQAVSTALADDPLSSTSPLMVIGGEALATEPSVVTASDAAIAMLTLTRKLVTHPYSVPEDLVQGQVSAAMTGTSDVAVIAAQGSGVRIYVTQMHFFNNHATQETEVVIKDDTTELFRVFLGALDNNSVPVTLTFPSPLRLTANVALQVANITTASSTWVSASGFSGV